MLAVAPRRLLLCALPTGNAQGLHSLLSTKCLYLNLPEPILWGAARFCPRVLTLKIEQGIRNNDVYSALMDAAI
eukprot:1153802-Pelagomonas_calceolata.AAC.2